MNWSSIRLELGRSESSPNGSVSRAYLLRLPIGDDGLIDRAALEAVPQQATMRRLWPNEPDASGHVVRVNGHWALAASAPGHGPAVVAELEDSPIREGSVVTITERSGERLPFRVAKMRSMLKRQA